MHKSEPLLGLVAVLEKSAAAPIQLNDATGLMDRYITYLRAKYPDVLDPKGGPKGPIATYHWWQRYPLSDEEKARFYLLRTVIDSVANRDRNAAFDEYAYTVNPPLRTGPLGTYDVIRYLGGWLSNNPYLDRINTAYDPNNPAHVAARQKFNAVMQRTQPLDQRYGQRLAYPMSNAREVFSAAWSPREQAKFRNGDWNTQSQMIMQSTTDMLDKNDMLKQKVRHLFRTPKSVPVSNLPQN